MAQYDDAGSIINSAAVECGLNTAGDPFSSTDPTMAQLRTLLTNAGRELFAMHQWQQFVKTTTISTGPVPVSNGQYALPADFGYMINQTGWTPTAAGLGLPFGGPLSEQIWAALVNTNLASSTIYVSFKIADRVIQFLPAPAPANTSLTYSYMSRDWVLVSGGPTTADFVATASDLVLFEPILITKLLALRYKQAKGLDPTSTAEQFAAQFMAWTGVNTPAPVLNVARYEGFPYLNVWTNVPQSGYGF